MIVADFRVMELERGEISPYSSKSIKPNYPTEKEAEDDIVKHLSKMGDLLGDTPVLFVIKTFRGV
jgi:hypothetical protein